MLGRLDEHVHTVSRHQRHDEKHDRAKDPAAMVNSERQREQARANIS